MRMEQNDEIRVASEGAAVTLHAPLASASSADGGSLAMSVEHHWSVLAAILLIIAAVAWSLLRQRAGRH